MNLPNFVTETEQDDAVDLLRAEYYEEAAALIAKSGDPRNFFGQNDRAWGPVFTEFVLTQNIEAMKTLWQHGAQETHNRYSEGILECLRNYATNLREAHPAFSNVSLIRAFADTERFYRETGGLKPESFYMYVRDLTRVVQHVNAQIELGNKLTSIAPGAIERITDFGDKLMPFVAQRVEQLQKMDIKPLDGVSGWQNGVYAVFEDFPEYSEKFETLRVQVGIGPSFT